MGYFTIPICSRSQVPENQCQNQDCHHARGPLPPFKSFNTSFEPFLPSYEEFKTEKSFNSFEGFGNVGVTPTTPVVPEYEIPTINNQNSNDIIQPLPQEANFNLENLESQNSHIAPHDETLTESLCKAISENFLQSEYDAIHALLNALPAKTDQGNDISIQEPIMGQIDPVFEPMVQDEPMQFQPLEIMSSYLNYNEDFNFEDSKPYFNTNPNMELQQYIVDEGLDCFSPGEPMQIQMDLPSGALPMPLDFGVGGDIGAGFLFQPEQPILPVAAAHFQVLNVTEEPKIIRSRPMRRLQNTENKYVNVEGFHFSYEVWSKGWLAVNGNGGTFDAAKAMFEVVFWDDIEKGANWGGRKSKNSSNLKLCKSKFEAVLKAAIFMSRTKHCRQNRFRYVEIDPKHLHAIWKKAVKDIAVTKRNDIYKKIVRQRKNAV